MAPSVTVIYQGFDVHPSSPPPFENENETEHQHKVCKRRVSLLTMSLRREHGHASSPGIRCYEMPTIHTVYPNDKTGMMMKPRSEPIDIAGIKCNAFPYQIKCAKCRA